MRHSNAYASSAASEEDCERMTVRKSGSACVRSLKAVATAPWISAGDRAVRIVRSSNHRAARYKAISSRSDCAMDDATNDANAAVMATNSRNLNALAPAAQLRVMLLESREGAYEFLGRG